ncbi:MAG TPA: MFS transporter [Gemmatimonadaceae bacterium]|nr:MFS transporter [Gemmatimonadaceae bacterium]
MNEVNDPLSRNVKALAAVSLLTDAASEMIYPLLPLFLSTVLGASASMIGTIEGLAESTASMLKLASGWWSDRVGRRKPFVVAGYGLAALVRPLMGLAQAPWQALVVRLSDRTGKGIRTSARDALLADSASPAQRGRAFGFLRAGDNAGAVIGPLVAWVMLEMGAVPLRTVFLWAAIPGVLAVVVLVAFVKEKPALRPDTRTPSPAALRAERKLGAPFWRYLVVLLAFTLGNSTDAFLLLRASQVGVPIAIVPILWAAFSLVKAVCSTPGGALSDRIGRRPVIVAGWALFAVVYLLFARATAAWQAWALFAIYGVSLGISESVEKALVADLVPAARRGAAYGWYNFVIGIGALPASVVFGIVWDRVSPAAAFTMGASLVSAAAIGLLTMVPRSPAE